ncbi:MAG: hypothetical protein JW720_12215 [Sedimentisphaerales bacterium]|nr:hypothetical protein [Sedimentisphaerales bacterium]
MPTASAAKYKYVAQYCGLILDDLVVRCTEVKGDNSVIKPRYYFCVLLYGSSVQLWGRPEMDIKEAAELFANSGNTLGLGGHLGGTDTQKALQEAYDRLTDILAGGRFADSFPPMVFHLTDGMSHTDASKAAEQIKQLSTEDGNVLLVNAYIGTQTSLNYRSPDDFPGYLDVSEVGSSEDNVRLFNMSSETPETIETNLKADGIFPQFRSGSRLFFDVRTKDMLKNVIQVVGSTESRMEK